MFGPHLRGRKLFVPNVPWRESAQILGRTKQRLGEHQTSLLAAGVAFYAFVSLFPALIAAVSIYGLVADPAQVQHQVDRVATALPAGADELVADQLRSIASGSGSALGWSLVLSVLAALFTASAGVQNLVKAVNAAYEEDETRSMVGLRLRALAGVLAAVVVVGTAVGLIAVLPSVFRVAGLAGFGMVLAQVARWVGLVVLFAGALALVYRLAPARREPPLLWVGLGTGVATALWVLGSALFSLYVSTFGSYSETYGSLAGVVVLLFWLFLTSFCVLLGAEVNRQAELRAGRDGKSVRPSGG